MCETVRLPLLCSGCDRHRKKVQVLWVSCSVELPFSSLFLGELSLMGGKGGARQPHPLISFDLSFFLSFFHLGIYLSVHILVRLTFLLYFPFYLSVCCGLRFSLILKLCGSKNEDHQI